MMEPPSTPQPGSPAPDAPVGETHAGGRGVLRILQVEDDPTDALLCRRELEKAGWVVQADTVETREEFSVRIWSGQYDLVLVDYQLKGWRGIEAVEALKRLRRDVPVILVTGSIGEENVAEALHRGIADYVIKERLWRLPLVIERALGDKRQRSEKKRLAEERDRFFMLSSDLLCILDIRGAILQLNPAWQRALGFELEDLVKQPVLEWVHPEDRPKMSEGLRSLSNGAAGLELETRFLAANGSCRWLQWRASCLPRQSLIYATVRDVTETKVLQGQLLRAQRIESIGTLANGIAHDLNNVLTPILMAVDILQEIATDARTRKLLNTVQSSAQHGASMVKQILAFSRGAEGEKVPIDLRQVVTQVRDFAKDTFPSNLEIRAQIATQPARTLGDATQLHQVLLNLCVNARDAMSQGGVLSIELTERNIDEHYSRLHLDARPGAYHVVSVTDTGTGIPPELIEKIFEPFFTTKDPGKGTGLGLSTVLGIVRGHGGFLNVYSEPGKGTRFSVYLPVLSSPAPASLHGSPALPVAEPPEPVRRGDGECVLVVDDDDSFRDITRSILESANYRVLVARRGREAITVLEQNVGRIQLVITDMMMPGMDGTTTLRALHGLDPSLRMMATSGMPVQEPYTPLEDSRVVPFLTKPYDAARLLSKVREAILQP